MGMKQTIDTIRESLRLGWSRLVSRKLYVAMFAVPVLVALFFVSLMSKGLPDGTPIGVVDQDHSSLSRQVTRDLASSQLLSVTVEAENYHAALSKVRSGEIFGFFLIPPDFQQKTIAGEQPTLTFYSNMTYFVPGTLSFKGFKTVAVTTSAGVAINEMQSMGVTDEGMLTDLLQPVSFDTHPLHNPWLNYSVYLSNSFVPGTLALMVLLMTCYSVCEEIKRGTSVRWLATARGSMVTALFGKLAPQAIVWTCVGLFILSLLYGFEHFPLNNHLSHMIAAIFLLVVACQGFSLAICEMLPNLRLAMSINSLLGILSFSVTGFSFPVQNMYGAIGIFSYIIPLRYYFLIYVDQALNGIPLYYSRWFYIALLIFVAVPFVGLSRLRSRCVNPIYVP